MPVITISRGSYSKGKEVAEGIAAEMGYRCVSREVLLEASQRFAVPELALLHAMHDAPSLLNKFGDQGAAYRLYIQTALLDYVRQDNVVYHGLAGHVLLRDIGAVLRVRVLADLETRVSLVSEREKVSCAEARRRILRIDRERRAWTRKLHGVDPRDSSLYDLVVSIEKTGVPGAVAIICRAAELEAFQLTDEARREIEDLSRSCQVRSHLLDIEEGVEVSSEYGNVVVRTRSTNLGAGRLEKKVAWIQENVEGINNIEIRTSAAKLRTDR